jgi:AcrR family transcriptional regulator
MARTQEQNEKMSLLTKEKIMQAGLRLFSRKGFSMTSIKDIAQTAGISTGLIYRHFATKEELFDELLKNTIQEMSRAIRFLDSDISPAQTFTKLTSDILNDIQSSDELSDYFLLITRCLLQEKALPQMEVLKKVDLSLFENAAKLIEKGQKLGEFKQGNSYKLSLMFFSIIQGIANMKLFMGDKYIAPEVKDIMVFLLK